MRASRLAVAALFLVNGALFGNWVSRIPAVQERIGMSEGLLGLALLGLALGALFSMPLTGWLVSRVGSRGVTAVAVFGFALALPLVALPGSFGALVAALLLLGATHGALDVSMNSQGAEIEKLYDRPIMNSFHAMFSFGGLIGAGGGGVLAALGVGVGAHFVGVAVVFGLVAVIASRYLLHSEPAAGRGEPAFVRPNRALVWLGVMAFCVLVGEGAMADWSAVYLSGNLGTGPGLAAAGYAAFSLMMAIGRLTGDRLNELFGAVALVRSGGLLAAAGLSLTLLTGSSALALVGFGLVGAGFSIVFPIVLSTAAGAPGMAPGAAIAAMSSTGYFGFLIGPPLIGFVAELITLQGALFLIVLSSLAVAALARNADPKALARL